MLAGPIGTGKTHLAIALGIEAARQRRVLFTRAADLVRTLVESRDAREPGRLQRRLDGVDLLILDELGFEPFDRAGGELLFFNVIATRYEKHSVLLTTNSRSPNGRRFSAATRSSLHHATVISTRGKSFRMRKREAHEDAASTKAAKSGRIR